MYLLLAIFPLKYCSFQGKDYILLFLFNHQLGDELETFRSYLENQNFISNFDLKVGHAKSTDPEADAGIKLYGN